VGQSDEETLYISSH